MKIALILDYDVKKSLLVFEMEESATTINSEILKTKIRNITSDYFQTESGKKCLNEKQNAISLHDFFEIRNEIPETIYRKYGIRLSSADAVTNIFVENAFTILHKGQKICAFFLSFDEAVMVEKHEMRDFLDRVNWAEAQYPRTLRLDGRCVGLGFLTQDILYSDNSDFSLKEFLNYAAQCAISGYLKEENFSNQGFSFVILRLS